MSDSDLVAALRPVAQALEAMSVPYHIGGSVASSAHGIARASLDADVVAALGPEHVEGLMARLGGDYYIPVDRLRSAVARRASCNLIHLATMFKIDVFVSKGRPYDQQAAARARPQALDSGPDAPRFPVASAEDTVLAKLEGFRRGGETSERQWWDVVGVLRVTPGVDRAYLEHGPVRSACATCCHVPYGTSARITTSEDRGPRSQSCTGRMTGLVSTWTPAITTDSPSGRAPRSADGRSTPSSPKRRRRKGREQPLVSRTRDSLPESRRAAPGWLGATTAHIGHM